MTPRLAYVAIGGTNQFAVGSGEEWLPFDRLGLAARTTGEAIEVFAEAIAHASRLDAGQREELVLRTQDVRLLCPIVAPSKILATGMNYDSHNSEMTALMPALTDRYVELAQARPERPLLFSKYPGALLRPGGTIEINTAVVGQCDYEVELAVVIGRTAKNLTMDDAWTAVFGVTVANDVSARDWVLTESQFMRGKSFDTFCPVGPWIAAGVAPDDLAGRRLGSRVNGEPRQSALLDEMTFSIAEILVHASAGTTLSPGDVVLTGTPPGVGFGMTPQRFLQDGDVVECEIEGVGVLRNVVTTVHEPAGLIAATR